MKMVNKRFLLNGVLVASVLFSAMPVLSMSLVSRAKVYVGSLFGGSHEKDHTSDAECVNQKSSWLSFLWGAPKKTVRIGNNDVSVRVGSYNGKEVVQLPVKNQFESDGGGGASCGLHALKNGIETTLALCKKDVPADVQQLVSEEDLKPHLSGAVKDTGKVSQLFGDSLGLWRRIVVRERTLGKFGPVLSAHLSKALCAGLPEIEGLDPEKVKALYKTRLDSVSKNMVAPCIVDEIGGQIDIKKEVIDGARRAIGQLPLEQVKAFYWVPEDNQTVEDARKKLQDVLCSDEVFNKCIDASKLTFLSAPQRNMNDYQSVDGVLLETIIKREFENGCLAGVRNEVSVLVYEDVSVMGQEFDANAEKLREAMSKIHRDPNHIILVCAGTMEQSRGEGGPIVGTYGHWFPIVWTKDRVYVMDSLGDADRLDDARVSKVIGEIERMRTLPSARKFFGENYNIAAQVVLFNLQADKMLKKK